MLSLLLFGLLAAVTPANWQFETADAIGTQTVSAGAATLGKASPLEDRILSQFYVRQASSIELLAIRSAELAIRRSRDPSIRSAAIQSLREHTGLSSQLAYAGRRLNLLPAATLIPDHERLLLQLINSPDFNVEYVRQRRVASVSGHRLHRDYLRTGTSTTLRLVAGRAVVVFSSEIERFRRL